MIAFIVMEYLLCTVSGSQRIEVQNPREDRKTRRKAPSGMQLKVNFRHVT